ncbi:MAG: CTP synthase, partial [Patescibacteria group bacterium]|nr:CTP synthase [Patescibacteria group bacterium]
KTKHPVIDILESQKNLLREKLYGGTMRLGNWPCYIKKNTIAHQAYRNYVAIERHRHRYEVNPKYQNILQENGLIFSGIYKEKRKDLSSLVLAEIIELDQKVHPFFVGTQFHPEFKSTFLSPHPLFLKFILNAGRK